MSLCLVFSYLFHILFLPFLAPSFSFFRLLARISLLYLQPVFNFLPLVTGSFSQFLRTVYGIGFVCSRFTALVWILSIRGCVCRDEGERRGSGRVLGEVLRAFGELGIAGLNL